jgi:hypothetical protein
MNAEKIAKVIGDYRSIWLGILTLLAAAAWAGDQRWALKEDNERMINVIEMRQLSQRNEELEIQKSYETDQQRIRMLEAVININNNKIEAIKNEQELRQ